MKHATVVFPHASVPDLLTDGHRRWLARGDVQSISVAREPLDVVLAGLGLPAMAGGQAALRYLGQTGRSVAGWMAAADPIIFVPRLRDIVAQKVPPAQLQGADLRSMIDTVQAVLATANGTKFHCMGHCGYLESAESILTPAVSPQSIHGFRPDAYLPAGPEGRPFHRIHSELQMLLHEHPANQRRAALGLPAINGLWIWGGGTVPAASAQDLPVLFSDDPLFTGYWQRFDGRSESWPGSIRKCIDTATNAAVITVPESGDGAFDQAAIDILDDINRLMKNGRLRKVTMIFSNELHAELRWSDRVRFWRSPTAVLSPREHYG